PPMTEGNAYEQHEPSLPTNLRDALRQLEGSEMMKDYIGEEYLDGFVLCKENELEEVERTISDLEYMWYRHTVRSGCRVPRYPGCARASSACSAPADLPP